MPLDDNDTLDDNSEWHQPQQSLEAEMTNAVKLKTQSVLTMSMQHHTDTWMDSNGQLAVKEYNYKVQSKTRPMSYNTSSGFHHMFTSSP